MPSAVEEYVAATSGVARERLDRAIGAISAALPDAAWSIRYGMPAIALGGRHHLHVAAWAKHLGVYPVYRDDNPLEAEIAPFRDAKDALRFPYAGDQPDDLLARVAVLLADRAPRHPDRDTPKITRSRGMTFVSFRLYSDDSRGSPQRHREGYTD